MYKRKPPHFIPPILNHKDEWHPPSLQPLPLLSITPPPPPPPSTTLNPTISSAPFLSNFIHPSYPGCSLTNSNELKIVPVHFSPSFYHPSSLGFYSETSISSSTPVPYSHVTDTSVGFHDRENSISIDPHPRFSSLKPPPPPLPTPSMPRSTTPTPTIPIAHRHPISEVYSSLKTMTQVQKLPHSLGPPGDPETAFRRIKMQQAKWYSNQLRYQWKRTWERRLQHQKQQQQR